MVMDSEHFDNKTPKEPKQSKLFLDGSNERKARIQRMHFQIDEIDAKLDKLIENPYKDHREVDSLSEKMNELQKQLNTYIETGRGEHNRRLEYKEWCTEDLLIWLKKTNTQMSEAVRAERSGDRAKAVPLNEDRKKIYNALDDRGITYNKENGLMTRAEAVLKSRSKDGSQLKL